MAVTLLRTWDGHASAVGYELRIDLSDGVREHNRQVRWPAPPTADQVAEAVAREIALVEMDQAPELPPAKADPVEVVCEDGTVVTL